jgi:hypothetical protein
MAPLSAWVIGTRHLSCLLSPGWTIPPAGLGRGSAAQWPHSATVAPLSATARLTGTLGSSAPPPKVDR